MNMNNWKGLENVSYLHKKTVNQTFSHLKSDNVLVYVKHFNEYEFTHRDGYHCIC